MSRFANAFLLLSALVLGTEAVADETRSGIIDVSYASRVLHFDHTRNAISPEGVIAVCVTPFTAPGNNICSNSQGENKWLDIFAIDIPGYRLVAFEHRAIGNNRHLFLYFRRKES